MKLKLDQSLLEWLKPLAVTIFFNYLFSNSPSLLLTTNKSVFPRPVGPSRLGPVPVSRSGLTGYEKTGQIKNGTATGSKRLTGRFNR
jgi:hypothetical protein